MTRGLAVLSAALLAAVVLQPARSAPAAYKQTYLIIMKGVPSGTETVSEDLEGENLVASTSSEIFLSDALDTKRMAFVTRLVLSKLYAPISYSYRYTSGPGDGYEVKVQGAQVSRVLTRNGRSSEAVAPLAPGAVILDFSVYHQFDYVVRKYDFKKGGRQSFANFIPLIAAEVPLALTRIEDTKLEHAGGALPVRNFRVEFVGVWTGTLSVDAAGRLARLLVRDQNLEVVRKDLVPDAPLIGAPRPSPTEPSRPAAQPPPPRY
jgi:hypothetical protein